MASALPVAPGPTRSQASHTGIVVGALLLAFGILLFLAGGALLTAGIATAVAGQVRDEEGFFVTPTQAFTTDAYALTSPASEPLRIGRGIPILPFDIATVKLQATSEDAEVFIGIASQADVDDYLEDVAYTEIRRVEYFPFEVHYRNVPGSDRPPIPAEMDIWVESATGSGQQEIEWSIASGDWGVVVMNADGTAGVDVGLQAGVRSGFFAPTMTALLVLGAVLVVLGIPLVVIGSVLIGRGSTPPPTGQHGAVSGSQPAAR